MKKVRFAVVGMGHIGTRHATHIREHEHAELVAVVDVNPDRLKEFQEHSSISVFNSLVELLDSAIEIDVVNICSPSGLHCNQAIQVLETNCHVVIEKPMGLSSVECSAVIQVAKQKDRKVFIVKQNRYSPLSNWMKAIISNQLIGQIYEVHIRCFWNRDLRYYNEKPKTEINWRGSKSFDGGVLFTQFSHFVDVMYWVFGDIRNIETKLRNNNHSSTTEFPDSGSALFEFVNGGVGSLHFSTSVVGENLESSMTVLAEKGSFKVGGQYMEKLEFLNIPGYQMPELEATAPANDYGLYKGSAGNHALVIQNVMDVLNYNDSIATGGEEGMKVVDIIERIYAAGKKTVPPSPRLRRT